MTSNAEKYLEIILQASGIPFVREYRFDPERKWRADFAIPEHKILIEVEGGNWTQGRHNRGKGYEDDCEKYNAATMQGWRVLRFTPGMLMRTDVIQIINSLVERSR
jgi:very-short-patch-repair endonuclease